MSADASPSDPWKHEHVQANGIRFHYVTAGTGPLVLLLHGFPQFWYGWRKQIPALAKKFRVVAPDMRGYGGTDKPPRVSDYKVETLADDIKALIEALGEKKAHVVAHDWGGAVAWQLARQHGAVVDRLAVLNCPPADVLARHLRWNFRQIRRSWYIFFFQLPWFPERAILKNDAAVVPRMFRGISVNKAAFSDEDLAELKKNIQIPGAITSMLNYYRAAGFRALLKKPLATKITAPTLVIWGEGDLALGKELTYGLERLFTGPYRIEYIPNCNHFVNEEQPERVNELLLKHLSE